MDNNFPPPLVIRRRRRPRVIQAVGSRTKEELLELWRTETDFAAREQLIDAMKAKGIFPNENEDEWERTSGAYPDLYDDPNFIKKLLERREFAECYQAAVDPDAEGGDPCVPSDDGFQLSAVQRFVANFMSPKTPYKSALLYHGVGVGKTCSAVQIAEQWLHFYPKKQVIILAPPTIQAGFKRNIFDIDKLVIGTGNEPNNCSQCTGNIYLELTNTLYERDAKKIENKVKRMINRRYDIQGYGEFANVIKKLLAGIPEDLSSEERKEEERRLIEETFNGKLLIVDEAHNLRDLAKNVMDDEPDGPGAEQKTAEAEGKRLTQWLRKLLQAVDGMKLVLMTATPMYDSYREIIFLLNLILLNEKKPQLTEADVFTPSGEMTERGRKLLGMCCRRYVSFMRGENPDVFPLRLRPDNTLTEYPSRDPRGARIKDSSFIEHLPIVPIPVGGESLQAQRELMADLPPGKGGISATIMGRIIQAGTCIVPEFEGDENNSPVQDVMSRTSAEALKIHFYKQTVGGEVTYKAKREDGALWLANSKGYLPEYAPKMAYLLRNVKKCEGVAFVYSRFVSMGAIPLALALEANGYTPYGRRPMLGDGIQSAGGRQCSRCPSREENHANADHEFSPARYVLLTGDTTLSSSKNKDLIDAARNDKNVKGEQIKIIIGSEVASEGVDLRFIREIHILEGWYHLSKTEQVIGRGIRTYSHCLLPPKERNCTVYLYALVMPTADKRETADLYTYRMAWAKARQVGAVTRLIKENAVDCNLNHDAIIINNRRARTIRDSRGHEVDGVDVNDKAYTAICDWMDSCEYSCSPKVTVEIHKASEVSYDEFTSRWLDSEMRRVLRNIFSTNPSVNAEDLNNQLAAYPSVARISLLRAVVGNKSFVVMNNGREGYIIYRNGLYLFQPFIYRDLRIPRAIRMASFPVRRDAYSPALMSLITPEAPKGKVAAEDELVAEPMPTMDLDAIKKVYSSWRKWAKALASRDTLVPDPIRTWLDGQVGRNAKVVSRRLDRLNAVRWFASAGRAGRMDPADLESVLLEFMFDEEMTAAEQFSFYAGAAESPDMYELGMGLSPMQFKRVGRNSVFLNVNISDGQLKFICGADGKACKASIVDLIKEEDIFDYKVYAGNTGELYGFLIPKNGVSLVFKTGKPAATKTGKIDKGQECANVSNASDHRKKLIRLGAILTAARMHNLNLTENLLTSEPDDADKLKNVAQLCALMDLVLRYMDKRRVLGRRWFYRTVEANIFGHQMPGRKGGAWEDDNEL